MNLGSLAAALPTTVAALALLAVPGAVPAPVHPALVTSVAGVAAAHDVPAGAAAAHDVPAGAAAHDVRVGALSPANDPTADAAVAATNARRAAVGAGPVRWNACLLPYSQRWATTLAGRGSLAHQDLNPLLTGCSLSSAGENVAMGYDSAAAVVTAWMNSPGHRANLLNPTFTQVTVATATDGSGRRYWVMNLGARADAPAPVESPRPTPSPAPMGPQPGRAHRPIGRHDAVALTPHR